MAYLATYATSDKRRHGQRQVQVIITETEAATGSEYSFELPGQGPWEIVLFQATLTAGTGTTIQPKLGKVTAWAANSQNVIATQAASAVSVLDETQITFSLTSGQTVFGRSLANDLTADHSITTLIVFREL